jgi:hypothetical protein
MRESSQTSKEIGEILQVVNDLLALSGADNIQAILQLIACCCTILNIVLICVGHVTSLTTSGHRAAEILLNVKTFMAEADLSENEYSQFLDRQNRYELSLQNISEAVWLTLSVCSIWESLMASAQCSADAKRYNPLSCLRETFVTIKAQKKACRLLQDVKVSICISYPIFILMYLQLAAAKLRTDQPRLGCSSMRDFCGEQKFGMLGSMREYTKQNVEIARYKLKKLYCDPRICASYYFKKTRLAMTKRDNRISDEFLSGWQC